MNRIYRTLWSAATQSWQAVPETAKSAGKKSKSSAGGIIASVALGFSLNGVAHAQSPPALPPAINQLPTGGTVVRGTATIQQTVTAQAAAMTVNQSSQRAVVNWNTFNLGSAASINFVQPNAQAVTLNRVNDSNPSQIFGRITANGQVFITNANGIYFSPTSSVDVGAITATTHSITDDNFMSGRYVFDRNGSTGKVVNEGHITAALGGYVALLAPEVQNAGVVVARAGTVAMAAGELITLSVDGAGSLAGITTTPSAIASLVENKLAVLAPDGQIILSAVALDKLQAGVVRNSGSLEANSLVNKGGKIVLEGDEIVMDRNSRIEAKGRTGGGVVLVGGDWQGSGDLRQATKVTMEAGATIDASATDNGDGGKVVLWSDIHNADSVTRVNGSIKAEAGSNGGDGGQVETSGHVLNVDGVQVSTKAAQGATGGWLLDPYDVYIMKDATTTTETLASGTYTPGSAASYIKSSELNTALGSSNVTVTTGGASPGSSNGNIFVYDGVAYSANKLTLNAWNNIYFYFPVNVTGTGSLALEYGQKALAASNTAAYFVDAPINLPTGQNFSTKLGSNGGVKNFTVINTLGVQGDAASAPTVMTLQGMAATTSLAGNYVLGSNIDATATQSWNTVVSSYANFIPIGKGQDATAAFTGSFDGLGHQVQNIKIRYTGTNANDTAGLFGTIASTASISNVAVVNESVQGYGYVGGLIGSDINSDSISINNVFTSGAVTGTGLYVGGLMGLYTSGSGGRFKNAASSANVTSSYLFSGRSFNLGGIFGLTQGYAPTNTAFYGTVSFTGSATNTGGLVGGGNSSGAWGFSNGYFDSTKNSGLAWKGSSNTSTGTNVLGLATSALTNQSNFTGFDFVNVWAMGTSYPLPQFMVPNIVRVTPGSASMVYGNTPSVNMTYIGLQNGDTAASVFATLPTATAPAITNVGSQTFSASGGVLNTPASYSVVYDPATVTIVPKPLSLSGLSVNTNKVYNGSTGATYTGTPALLSTETKGTGTDTDGKPFTGDVVSLLGTAGASYNSKDVATATTISLTGLSLTGSGASNYVLAPSALSYSGTITPKVLTITSPVGLTVTPSKTYDGTTAAIVTGTLTAGSLLAFETANTGTVSDGKGYTVDGLSLILNGTATAVYSQSNVGTGLTINYSGLLASTTSTAGNYVLTASTAGVINKATATVTASKTYDGGTALSTGNVSITGVSVGGVAQTLSYTGTASLSDANVATANKYVITSGMNLGSGTGLASNYLLPSSARSANNTATIQALALTATSIDAGTSIYGNSYATGAVHFGNVVGSDAVSASVSLSVPAGSLSAGLKANVGTYDQVASTSLTGAQASNYSFAGFTSPSSYTVTQRTLTGVSIASSQSTYGNALSAGAVTFSNMISGDAVTATAVVNTSTLSAAGVPILGTYTQTVGAALGGADAGNYLFAGYTTPTANYTIAARPLSLSIPGATRVYDGTTSITPSGAVTLSGVLAAEVGNVSLSSGSVTGYVDKNVGNNKTVTYTGFALTGSDAANYTLPANPTSNADITAKPLTVSASAVTKVYDGTTSATGAATVGALASGDSVGVAASVAFTDKDVGTNKTVQVSALTIKDAANADMTGNYAITYVGNTASTITAKPLTVTASNDSKTYDGLAYTGGNGVSYAGFVNNETSSVLGGSVSYSGSSQNAINAGSYTITPSGLTSSNYAITFADGLLTVNKANATVTASSGSVTYTGLAQSVSGFTATGFVNGETAAVLSGVSAGATGTNAGSYASVASGTDGNYNLTFVNGALTIHKASATVTASSGSTTYNGLAQSVSGFTVTGLVNNEAPAVLTGVSAGVTATNAGTYASTASGTDTNYNLTFVNGAFTINKANATVTANSGTATYTGVAQSVSGFTATGLVNGEAATVLTGVTASGTGTNAGTYASTASGTDINYNLTFVPGALTINKAHLTVTANNANKTYGDTNPALSATVSGFVNGETLGTSGVSGAGAASTTATALTGAGTATITPSLGTLAASNYDFTNWVNGTLTINKANATVTASSGTVTYTGLAQSVSGFTASGLVNGEAATVLTGVSTSGGAGTNAGNYTHIASGTDSNYNLTFVNGALTIGKANATVIANGGTTTYNGAAQSVSGFTATGLVNGETTAVLSGVTAGATGTNAGTYTSTAIGTDSNYNLSFTNGTYTINKAPLSVSLTGQTKVYDGTTSATLANGSLTLTGFMSGEAATVSQTQASYNSANVLNASTVTATLAAGNYTASNGALLSNYVLPTTASGTGSITPARLSATGTKTYDGLVAFDATGLTVSGVNGETFAATGSGTMGSKNVQTNQALSSIAGLSLSGNNGALTSNYVALATSDTQVSVTPLAVNLSAPAATKTYDSTTLYQVSAADLATLSSQLVGNDRVTAADVVYANKDAGTGKRVSLNSVTISDDNGGNNYTVGKLDVNTGVINKAPLAVTVVNDARFINQSDATGFAGVVYNGLVGGETASVLTAGNITRSNASVNGAGQYTGVLQASGWQAGNYNISYNAGDYTIVGAHTLLVRVPTVSTTYGTAAAYTPTAEYLNSNNTTIMTLNPVMTNNALSVNDGVGGQASFTITAANATLSSSGNVQAGGYNLQTSNVVKTGTNFQNLVIVGGLTVTPKVLNSNLGVQPITKVYDGSASISNLGLSFNQPLAGVTTGDTVSLVGSGSFDDRHVATNKTVNLSLGLLGADATNYALATPSFSTNTGSITQLASVTYTGASNGNWSDFSNWAGGAMPDRNNVAQAVVPTGKTVVYNSDQVGTIGSTLAVDGAVRFTSSNAFTLANTVSGTGDLQQRGNGMLTVSGTNTNFSGNLDIGSYQATLNNAQALGTGHVVSNGGQLSVASGVTLNALHVDGAVTVDTAIKTTGDQVYNGALTFLSSGTVQAPNFVSDAGNVDFLSTVSAGSGAMTAQRSLAVSAAHGSVLFNDQVGRLVKNLDFNTYLTTGLLDTSPYALTVTAPTIKLFGDVTTFESQTYDGAVRVGNNGQNGHTRLLVSVDPSITFKGTVDDADPTGKVNGLDVRAISLSAIAANTPVPTITFENNVGSTSPLASLRLAAGTQSTVSGAMVTDIKTDDTSRRDAHYKGDIVLKGDVTVDTAPEMIAEQLLVPNGSPTMTWYTGTPDFRLRLPVSGSSSTPPSNLQLVQWGQNNNNNNNNNSSSSSSSSSSSGNTNTSSANNRDVTEAGRQWLMAHDTHERTTQFRANEAAMKAMDTPLGRMVADVQVGNETSNMPTVARGNSSRVEAQTVNVSSSGAFLQVREFAPQTLQAQQAFVYQLPADTFVHSRENEYIKLSATLSNGANLPRWVKFSVKDRSFSGEAPKHVKSLDVKVTATDRQGKRASTRIRLVFVNGSNS